jgi:hypothetical protein
MSKSEKTKNPAFRYGATPDEITKKLVQKALDAGGRGETDAENFLSTAVTAGGIASGAVSAFDLYAKNEASTETAREARKRHAEAWRVFFEGSACARWSGQSDASRWTVRQMAADLREKWKQENGCDPCSQSTAEKFLSGIHATIRPRSKR